LQYVVHFPKKTKSRATTQKTITRSTQDMMPMPPYWWNWWWYSSDTLSKLLNFLAILAAVSTVATVTLKFRLDNLKKVDDAPRQVTAEQRAKFLKFISEHPTIPKMPVPIFTNSMTNETTEFVNQLGSLLDDAGFGPSDNSHDFTGVTIKSTDPSRHESVAVIWHRLGAPAPCAGLIQHALTAAGIKNVGIQPKQDVPYLKQGEMLIYVTERR
jgi:hypothetical protein